MPKGDKPNPWGGGQSGGSGGRGQKPGGDHGRGNGPDLDDLIRKSQERMKGAVRGGGGEFKPRSLLLGALILLALWGASGFYRVNTDELGVVLRFGEYHRVETPGLAWHMPSPIERVLTPSVTSVNKVEVGSVQDLLRRAANNVASDAVRQRDKESMMLTADRNIVDISFDVQWKIDATAPQNFLFNVRSADAIVKPVAESAMREVIGRTVLEEENITETMGDVFQNQSAIALETKHIMQEMLDAYEAGIEVISVNLSKPDVPGPVIDEFQDIKRAEQDKRTAQNIAEGYRNEIIPKAKGQAEEMVQLAKAYRDRVVAESEGDAARFLSVYNEYMLAKDVTRKRMYLETMEEIMNGMPKYIIGQDGNGVLPFLPLGQSGIAGTKSSTQGAQ